jgi:hypothetical protein
MANASMPEEFFETVSHHLPPESPVGPKLANGRASTTLRATIPAD